MAVSPMQLAMGIQGGPFGAMALAGRSSPLQLAMAIQGGPLGAMALAGGTSSFMGPSSFLGSTAPAGESTNSMLGPISKGLGIASGVFDALNSFHAAGSYRSQARQYKHMAEQALQQGFEEGKDIFLEGKEVLGEMTAAFGKSGTLLEGSPLLTLADTGRNIEKNMLRAIRQGRINQQAYLNLAKQAADAAKSSKIGGFAKAFGGAALALI